MTDHLEPTIVDKIVALHRALAAGEVPHAFGGAIALAWCAEPRGTIDVDVNVFVPADQADVIVEQLPAAIQRTSEDLALLERDGQARLWWDRTAIDLFFNTTEFHEQAAGRAHWEPFAGMDIPFLACRDLAVFKAFFNRGKDWIDLQAMADAGALDRQAVLGVLVDYLGGTDERVDRLRALEPQPETEPPIFKNLFPDPGT
jgi:hypothetical protein